MNRAVSIGRLRGPRSGVGEELDGTAPELLTGDERMVMVTDPVMIPQAARLIADDLGGAESRRRCPALLQRIE